jgi:hypothetical protein
MHIGLSASGARDRGVRLKRTLSARAAIAVCVVAAVLGWAAVLGIIYAGRLVTTYIATSRQANGLNTVAPAAGRGEPNR